MDSIWHDIADNYDDIDTVLAMMPAWCDIPHNPYHNTALLQFGDVLLNYGTFHDTTMPMREFLQLVYDVMPEYEFIANVLNIAIYRWYLAGPVTPAGKTLSKSWADISLCLSDTLGRIWTN